MFRKAHSLHGAHHSKPGEHCSVRGISKEAFNYTQQRPYGLAKREPGSVFGDYVSEHIPTLLQEREFKLGAINKIFASKWLDDRNVVFGTKCNQLMVVDVTKSDSLINIPTLKSSDESTPADCPCGIHSVAVNPSRTLLATGASNTNDIAVYKLPTFDPVCVGETSKGILTPGTTTETRADDKRVEKRGHSDWVFDLVWIDDEFVISGSRDSHIALWKIDTTGDDRASHMNNLFIPEYAIKHPLTVKPCEKAQKVRALAFHQERKELAALSLNAYFHLWDMEKFTPNYSKKLHCTKENVCLAVNEKRVLYAVGSQSAVTLVDPRRLTSASTVISKHSERGIRSVSFNEDIITIGTGYGVILFYDLRAGKYIEHGCGHPCDLNVSSGWLKHDETYRDYFADQDYPNAIYTHAYDDSGTRLFAAGGPLPAGLWGNYAGMWY